MAKLNFIFDHLPVKKFRRTSFKKRIREIASVICSDEKIPVYPVNLKLCDDEFIKEFNSKYLGHDYYTDIITFDYGHDGSDILISTDTVLSNAEKFGVSFENELLRVVIHGMLHLAGYKDKTSKQKKIIRMKEDYYLNLIETYQS